jgi:hypothetical protein
VFGTPRTTAAGLDGADAFDTTPVIVGIIRNPVTNAVIFDPTSFDPLNDVLDTATIAAIDAAIAHQADLGLALNGVAYVSPGVTYATTVFGGAGNDVFNVYHNKGTLRLEGEAGNDEFVVRAFVTLDLSVQGNTEVNGGDGTDTVNYAINAPVSIDGGPGFDKVVVLGTPFNDAFVVTSQGIFGANLNVTFENVESAELDALEGNDTIYILGTNANIVTTVIGGLGGDTIQVLGDVMLPIVSNELGRPGVITQGASSGDAAFDDVGVNGVAVSIVPAAGDSLVRIEPTNAPLQVAEGGAMASYSISLADPRLARRRSGLSHGVGRHREQFGSPAARPRREPARVDRWRDVDQRGGADVRRRDGGPRIPDLGKGDRRLGRGGTAGCVDQSQHHQPRPGFQRAAAEGRLRQHHRQRPAGAGSASPDRHVRARHEHRSPGRRERLRRCLLGGADRCACRRRDGEGDHAHQWPGHGALAGRGLPTWNSTRATGVSRSAYTSPRSMTAWTASNSLRSGTRSRAPAPYTPVSATSRNSR